MVNIPRQFRLLWADSPSLTALFLVMLVVFIMNILGLFLDPRLITGAPAWLKPAKFSSSVAILGGTLAWMFRYLVRGKRSARIAGLIIAICAFLEIVIIDFQAARGVTSHFNISTPLNTFLFAAMGVSILVLWLATVWLCVLFFREQFADRPLGWALRLGLLISVLGSISGGLMTRPNHNQLAAPEHTRPTVVGGHTVGAPDGGPGLPVINWSTQHGDLRIPHFLGMHALQLVPLVYFLLIRKRRVSANQQSRQVMLVAASYAALTILLGWQALRGQSIATPDGTTLAALGLWTALTLTAFLLRPSTKCLSPFHARVQAN